MIERLWTVTRTLGMSRFPRRPADNCALKMSKHIQVDFVCRTVFSQQILQAFFVVVRVRQLENGFVHLLRQPNDCAANDGVIPLHVTYQPWKSHACQAGGCGLIKQHFHVRMSLEICRGNRRRHFAFDGLRNNPRFVFPERQDKDLASFQDRPDTHRDRSARHVFRAKEIAGRINASHGVQRDHASARCLI